MKKAIKVIADTLFYFVPFALISVLFLLYACVMLLLKTESTGVGITLLVAFGFVYITVLAFWVRLTPCRRKWDLLAPIAAALSPWYLFWLHCSYNGIFTLFILFPGNLFIITPMVAGAIVTLLAGSVYLRADRALQTEMPPRTTRVLLRVVSVFVACCLLAIPLCTAVVLSGTKEPTDSKNNSEIWIDYSEYEQMNEE